MIITSDEICQILADYLLVAFRCSQHSQEGTIRVETPFTYSDGGAVDVFVIPQGNSKYLITDYSDAFGWLSLRSARKTLLENQHSIMRSICQSLDVKLHNGSLQRSCDTQSAIADSICRVAQAMVRVADISFTFRYRERRTQPQPIDEEVDSWLRRSGFCYKKGVERQGQSGRVRKIDYQVGTPPSNSLIFLLSNNKRIDHVFTTYSDLKSNQWMGNLVSLFDDTRYSWREEDINILKRVSHSIMWSQPHDLEKTLTNHSGFRESSDFRLDFRER